MHTTAGELSNSCTSLQSSAALLFIDGSCQNPKPRSRLFQLTTHYQLFQLQARHYGQWTVRKASQTKKTGGRRERSGASGSFSGPPVFLIAAHFQLQSSRKSKPPSQLRDQCQCSQLFGNGFWNLHAADRVSSHQMYFHGNDQLLDSALRGFVPRPLPPQEAIGNCWWTGNK